MLGDKCLESIVRGQLSWSQLSWSQMSWSQMSGVKCPVVKCQAAPGSTLFEFWCLAYVLLKAAELCSWYAVVVHYLEILLMVLFCKVSCSWRVSISQW